MKKFLIVAVMVLAFSGCNGGQNAVSTSAPFWGIRQSEELLGMMPNFSFAVHDNGSTLRYKTMPGILEYDGVFGPLNVHRRLIIDYNRQTYTMIIKENKEALVMRITPDAQTFRMPEEYILLGGRLGEVTSSWIREEEPVLVDGRVAARYANGDELCSVDDEFGVVLGYSVGGVGWGVTQLAVGHVTDADFEVPGDYAVSDVSQLDL